MFKREKIYDTIKILPLPFARARLFAAFSCFPLMFLSYSRKFNRIRLHFFLLLENSSNTRATMTMTVTTRRHSLLSSSFPSFLFAVLAITTTTIFTTPGGVRALRRERHSSAPSLENLDLRLRSAECAACHRVVAQLHERLLPKIKSQMKLEKDR